MSDKELTYKYLKIPSYLESMLILLQGYADDKGVREVAGTAEPDVLADLIHTAKELLEVEKDGKIREGVEKIISRIKAIQAARFLKEAKELMKEQVFMGSSREAVTKVASKHEREYVDYRKILKGGET